MSTADRYAWTPIRELEVPPEELADRELATLAKVWTEQRQRLEESGQLGSFTEELCREFAIETGILERLYTLDRGVTRLLIERGIDASLIPQDATDQDPKLVAALIQDQHEAARSLFDFVGQRRELSVSFIRELHSLLTRHQQDTIAVDALGRQARVELRRGEWKQWPNNPQRSDGFIHEYAPPEQVASEMDRLVELHQVHLQEGWAPEVEASWLHHRFTQIHPFQDGNGRVARCLASLVLIRARWFPLVVDRDRRGDYIDALEAADAGHLKPLVGLVVQLQRRAFIEALSIARDVQRRERVTQIIEATRRDLAERREARREGWERLRQVGDHVVHEAAMRLRQVQTELEQELGDLGEGFEFRVSEAPSGSGSSHWFRYQIIRAAQELDYFANIREYHAWARLVLKAQGEPEAPDQTEILVSVHGLGREYTGVLAGTCIYFQKQGEAEAGTGIADVRPLMSEVLQINYLENEADVLARLGPWLEDALTQGLDLWRKSL